MIWLLNSSSTTVEISNIENIETGKETPSLQWLDKQFFLCLDSPLDPTIFLQEPQHTILRQTLACFSL